MLPPIRRQRIMDLLAENGAVNVSMLSELLSVSEMTIHRDLNQLADAGLLQKVRGGAVAATAVTGETAVTSPASHSHDTHCPTCYTSNRAHTQVILHLRDGSHQRTCCPHCGLMHIKKLGPKLEAALVTDFITGQVISAQSAFYIVAPDVTICCTPSTIAFRRQQDAERFQIGFGGSIMTMNTATAYILKAMNPNTNE